MYKEDKSYCTKKHYNAANCVNDILREGHDKAWYFGQAKLHNLHMQKSYTS
jgi:hypothetical protein